MFSASFLLMCGLFNPNPSFPEDPENEFEKERRDMVTDQIRGRGVSDEKVLQAMLKVKRHLFLPEGAKRHAYEDSALPIEKNQTISQPYIVALMTELADLKPEYKVLEIGTGSGYQAAVLAELVSKVYTIEIIPELAQQAKERLKKLGYKNIEIMAGDGYKGWPQEAPFDAIIVTAAAQEIPLELVKQLKTGSRMVIPLGDIFQELYCITKQEDGTFEQRNIIPVRFVPMVKGREDKK
ncbi:MAG: protein-L-isoaspartate(D-aspartate) O-methyltransferase [Candidatus Omnitrophota bacterium]